MKKIILSLFCLLLISMGCRYERCYRSSKMSDDEWNMFGLDTTNLSGRFPGNYGDPFYHTFIFEDELGKQDTLVQSLIQGIGFTSAFDDKCGKGGYAASVKDTLYSTHFEYMFSKLMDFHERKHPPLKMTFQVGNQKFEVTPFTNTLKDVTIHQVTYPKVFVYEADSSNFSPDSLYLKRVYFSSKKGLVKMVFTQNHVLERIK